VKFARALRQLAPSLGLLVSYYLTAQIGLKLNAVHGYAALIWPPSGIALAGLLIWGLRLWPAIFLAAFLVNFGMGTPLPAGLGIAVGNTLEAVIGAWLLYRIPGFTPKLSRLIDVVGLGVLAAIVSTSISALIGVTSLWLAGVVPSHGFGVTFRAWWMGDAMGVLGIAPFLMVWTCAPPSKLERKKAIEAFLLVACVGLLSLVLFLAHLPIYPIFPLMIWAAVGFEQHGVTAASLLVTIIAVWSTMTGHGYFAGGPIHEGLIRMHSFNAILTVTGLSLGAIVLERETARFHDERTQRILSVLLAVTEGTSDPLFIKDQRSIYIYVNAAFARFVGKKIEEILGNGDLALFPKATAEHLASEDRKIMQTGETKTFEESIPSPDGERIFLVNKAPYRDSRGKIAGVIGNTHDITALERSISLSQATLESTQDGILVVNRQGKIVEFNEQFTRLWHVNPSLLHHRDDQKVLAIVLEQLRDPESFLQRVEELYSHPEAESRDLIEFKDGRIFDRYSKPQRLGDRIVGRVWSFRDITARMRAEREREEALFLEKRARNEAERAARARDELIAVVSHDLKNPLTGILAGIELIQKQDWIEPKGKRPLEMVGRAATQMNEMIRNLLDIYRIEEGRFGRVIEGQRVIQHAATLAAEAVDLQQALASEKGISLTPEIPCELPMIWVDATQMRRVFQNLIGNALKFTPAGGSVRVKAEATESNVVFSGLSS
jgi:PAS domain S-box-containing protein